jgi:hypothetical protein
MEISEEQVIKLSDVTKRIGQETEDLGQKLTTRATEIERFTSNADGRFNYKEGKKIISRASVDMIRYASRMKVELPFFRESLNSGMGAFTGAISLSGDFDSENMEDNEFRHVLGAVGCLNENLTLAQESLASFRHTVSILPRMTTELNRAKREVVGVLDELISELKSGSTLMQEAEITLREFLT